MFYSHHVLARKGALGKVWLAAHWDKKLTKAAIWETKIPDTVDSIVSPEVPMALRLSGQLLLGVVRIYSRKVTYLYQDCNDALAKIKLAFRPGVVDLPAESQIAAVTTITLPDSAAEFELLLPESNDLSLPSIDQDQLFSATLNLSRPQDITMSQAAPLSLSYNADEDDDFFGADPNNASMDIEIPRATADDSGIEVLRGNPVHEDNYIPPDDFVDDMGVNDFSLSNDALLSAKKGADLSMDVSLNVDDSPAHSMFPDTPGTATGVRLSEAAIDSVQVPKTRKRRRKAALVDEQTYLDADTIRSSLRDTSDIVREFVPMPANRDAMREYELANSREPPAEYWEDSHLAWGARYKNVARRMNKYGKRPDVAWRDEEVDVPQPPTGPMKGSKKNAHKKRRGNDGEEYDVEDHDATAAVAAHDDVPVTPGDDFGIMDDTFDEGNVTFGDGVADASFGGDMDQGVPDTDDVPLVDDDVVVDNQGTDGQEGALSKEAVEAGWTTQTIKFHKEISTHFSEQRGKNPTLSLKEMLQGEKRGAAAQKFFQLLVLRKLDRVNVHQEESYADVTIQKTETFNDSVPELQA